MENVEIIEKLKECFEDFDNSWNISSKIVISRFSEEEKNSLKYCFI